MLSHCEVIDFFISKFFVVLNLWKEFLLLGSRRLRFDHHKRNLSLLTSSFFARAVRYPTLSVQKSQLFAAILLQENGHFHIFCRCNCSNFNCRAKIRKFKPRSSSFFILNEYYLVSKIYFLFRPEVLVRFSRANFTNRWQIMPSDS